MSKPDILTITLNPALDLSTQAASVTPGPKLRCTEPRRDPGGGGINVSRAIRFMGGDSVALVALGGATGTQLHDLMTGEGLRVHALPAPGDSRESLSVTDRSTGAQYRFVMPGPTWQAAHVAALIDACRRAAAPGGFVVLSGSLPPGVPADLPATLCRDLTSARARLVVDISGPALQALAASPPDPKPALLRFDHQEATELSGLPLDTPADSADFAENLVRRGVARAVMIARGREGNVLADGRTRRLCRPVPVEERSKVGAGDSFVGAAVLCLSRGGTMEEALQYGTAAANAAVMTEATELCRAEDVDRLRPLCRMEPV